MNENSFHINDDLLVKYLLDEASAEEKSAVEAWLTADPGNRSYFEQLRMIWNESKRLATSSTADENLAWEKFRNNISQPKTKPNALSFLRIAALFVIVAGISVVAYFFLKKDSTIQTLRVSATNSVLKDTLPDGSVITLNKNSSLVYPEKFKGDERAVNLQGEAFFNVTPDKKKPFLIHVNDVTIKVVGTSFNVRSENGRTEVIVATGIVQVIRNNKQVELRPGEKTVVRPEDSVPVKQIEKDKLYNYYYTKEFVCDGTPLWKLVEVLNQAYHVNIVIETPELRNQPLDVTFSNESLEQILKVIGLTLNAKADTSGNSIILR